MNMNFLETIFRKQCFQTILWLHWIISFLFYLCFGFNTDRNMFCCFFFCENETKWKKMKNNLLRSILTTACKPFYWCTKILPLLYFYSDQIVVPAHNVEKLKTFCFLSGSLLLFFCCCTSVSFFAYVTHCYVTTA